MFPASCFLHRIFNDFCFVVFSLYGGDRTNPPDGTADHSAGVDSLYFLFLLLFLLQRCVLLVFVGALFSPNWSLIFDIP